MKHKLVHLLIITGMTLPGWVPSTSAQESVIGTWEVPVELNVEGVHAALLPSGKVVYLPHRLHAEGTTESVVFDPSDPAGARYIPVPANYFCGGHTLLSDGRLLAMGGESITDAAIDKAGTFDHLTETWTEVADMHRVRWYPSAVVSGDGFVWVFGGQSEAANPDSADDTIEYYDPGANTWTMAGGQDIPGQYLEAYNRLHLMPDGRFFQSGHLPQTYYYDPAARSWTLVATTQLGQPRGNGSSVRLQDGRIMIVGGENKIDTFSSAEVIDLSQSSPQWQNVASMTSARAFTDTVMLPDGNVLVIGGDEELGPRAKTPELYNPAANSWTDMAPHAIVRGYHSTAILLPDARVVVSGGEGQGGPGVFGESSIFELWNPYYLFKSARPVIVSLTKAAAYGQQLTVSYTSEVALSRAVIHRSGSQTHSFTYNQISVPINFDSNTGSVARFTVPSNPNILPPGFYMIFLLNTDGVPSIAKFIRIGTSEEIFSDGFESGDTSMWSTP